MKRIAIPVKKGKLSEYFGQCGYYEIFEIENSVLRSNTLEIPPVKEIEQLPEWIRNQGITDIIVHKLDSRIISMFSKLKVNLFIGIPIDSTSELIQDYLYGNLIPDEAIINGITG